MRSKGCTSLVIRQLRLPEDVEQTLKILVMMPKQLASELASEEQAGPADNTLDPGMRTYRWLADSMEVAKACLLESNQSNAQAVDERHLLKGIC